METDLITVIATTNIVSTLIGMLIGYWYKKVRLNRLDNAIMMSERLLKKIKKGQQKGARVKL